MGVQHAVAHDVVEHPGEEPEPIRSTFSGSLCLSFRCALCFDGAVRHAPGLCEPALLFPRDRWSVDLRCRRRSSRWTGWNGIRGGALTWCMRCAGRLPGRDIGGGLPTVEHHPLEVGDVGIHQLEMGLQLPDSCLDIRRESSVQSLPQRGFVLRERLAQVVPAGPAQRQVRSVPTSSASCAGNWHCAGSKRVQAASAHPASKGQLGGISSGPASCASGSVHAPDSTAYPAPGATGRLSYILTPAITKVIRRLDRRHYYCYRRNVCSRRQPWVSRRW